MNETPERITNTRANRVRLALRPLYTAFSLYTGDIMDTRHFCSLRYDDGPDATDLGLRPLTIIDEPDVHTFDEYADVAGRHFVAQIDAADPTVPLCLKTAQPFRIGGASALLHLKLDCAAKAIRQVRDAFPSRRLGAWGVHEVVWWQCDKPSINPRIRNRRAQEVFGELIDVVDLGLFVPVDNSGNPTGTNLSQPGALNHLRHVITEAIEQAALLWRKPVRLLVSPQMVRVGYGTTGQMLPPVYWNALLAAATERLKLGQVEAVVRLGGWTEEPAAPAAWTDDQMAYLKAA